MKKVNGGKTWERTNVTNLLRNGQSGNYYARVKVNGKEKWRTLKTKVFSAAKLKLGDVERDERSKGMVAAAESLPQGGKTTVELFINIYLVRTKNDPALRPATRVRRETAVKAILAFGCVVVPRQYCTLHMSKTPNEQTNSFDHH